VRRRRGQRHHALARIALLLALALPACDVDLPAPPPPPDRDDAVTVGSFDFPESELVAEIYAQALESHGLEVVRVFAVGPRELTMPALERGLLEVMPEYSGSALDFLGGTPTANAPATFSALRDKLETRGLVTLRASAAEDRNVFVVTDDTAERLGVRHLSDLRDHAASLRIGGPPECRLRPLCLAGLEDRYDLRFERFIALDAAGPLTLQALDEGFVDVALLFSTHPRLRGGGLRVLVDDRGLQPAEQIVPLVAASAAARFEPALSAALDPVSEALTSRSLRLMNGQIDEGAPIGDVAHAWLAGHGLD
jgi:osmoprotectant transport system substrate-binding protein